MDPVSSGKKAWRVLCSLLDPLISPVSMLSLLTGLLLLVTLGMISRGNAYNLFKLFSKVCHAPVNCLCAYIARHHARSALIWAAKWGSETITKKLLSGGADVQWKSDFWSHVEQAGYTWNKESKEHPISYAAMLGHASIVELLLQHGADIEYQGREGRSPLVLATRGNHLPVVQLLIANGADLLSRDMWGGTPISYALSNGHNEILDFILKALKKDGHSEEYVKRGLQILLSRAAFNGDLERIQYALSNGADVNHQNSKGENTPLCLAARKANASTVKLLLESGANPNAAISADPRRTHRRRAITPLIFAVQNETDSEPMVRLLLNYGADAKIRGDSALYHAARLGRVTIFRLLVDHGAPLNCMINHVLTLMNVSIQFGQKSIVELLLEMGMQPSEKDWNLAKGCADPGILKVLEDNARVQHS